MVSSFVKLLKKAAFNSHLRSTRPFIKTGNSHFLDGFRLECVQPAQNKIYLTVGDDTMLQCRIIFESANGEVKVGSNSYIGTGNIICRSKIEIGDNVFIAWGGYLYDHDSHAIDYKERENDIRQQLEDFRSGNNFIANKNWGVVNTKPIKICSNAWIGMNCIILKGVTVGEGAIVGAGSVVTKDVPAWTVAAGNPARVVREIPEHLRKK